MQNKSHWLWWAIIILAVVLGLIVRFYDLTDAPLDFHPTRQLHSALIARGMYYQSLKDAPAWQKEMAVSQWKAEGLIEPQIMERLTALTYQVIGSEQLWVARVWSILFWMVGGIFLFLLVKQLSSFKASVSAMVVYLLWPYTTIASRSFQPESLLTAAILAGLWAGLRWMKGKTWSWAILASLLCGLAIYIKSVAVFFLAPPLIAMVLSNMNWKDALTTRQVWVIGLLAVLPYSFYHLYGVYGIGLLTGQFSLRFFPQRWVDPVFYLQWLSELNRIFPIFFLLLSLLGVILFLDRKYLGFLLGLLAGYILYGFVFAYHITTHDYYHIPLVIFVSTGFGLLVQGLLAKPKMHKNDAKYAVAFMLFILMCWNAWQVRSELKKVDFQAEVGYWQSLGEQLGHDKKVIGLLPDYGFRLAYWGWMNVSAWPSSLDIALRKLAGQAGDEGIIFEKEISGKDFFVVTEMEELRAQPELFSYLNIHFPKIESSEKIIIFNLNQDMEMVSKQPPG